MIKNRKAFTIVELVIVIAVIGILAGVLIPTFSNIVKNAHISNDQQVAGILTKDLLLANDGARIEDEATLMATLDKIENIDEKLTPQSAQYGYHFWFDMENQQVVVKTAADVAAIVPESQGESAAIDDESTVKAVSSGDAVVPLAETEPTNISLRDIYNKKHFFIDLAGSKVADILNYISEIDSSSTLNEFIHMFDSIDRVDEDYEFIIYIKKYVDDLTIKKNSGSFVIDTTPNLQYEYCVNLIVVNQNKYNNDGKIDLLPAPSDKKVFIPDSVRQITEGSLNYAEDVTISGIKDIDEIELIFLPDSTNATIKVDDGTEYVIDGRYVYDKTTENKIPENKAGELIKRLASETFEIGYSQKDKYVTYNGDTLYVAYGYDGLDFWAACPDNVISEAVEEWISSDRNIAEVDETGKISIVGSGYVTITANAYNINNENVKKTIKLFVNSPTAANIKVNGDDYELGKGPYTIDWIISDSSAVLEISKLNISYANSNFAKGAEEITVTLPNDSMFSKNNNNLSINAETGSTSFTVSVDGLLETTFNVVVADNSKSPIQVKFYNKSNNSTYIYYVGDDNEVTLGSLFGIKPGVTCNLAGATLNIYDGKNGNNIESFHANKTIDNIVATFGTTGAMTSDWTKNGSGEWVYNAWTLSENWDSQKIQFNINDTDYDPDYNDNPIYIRITPVNGIAIWIKFVIVDAVNVTTAGDLKTQANANNSVVMLNDVTLNDTDTSEDYNFTIGENKTLYANGFKLNATKLVSSIKKGSGTKTEYKYTFRCLKDHSHWGVNCDFGYAYDPTVSNCDFYTTDAYLIKLNGGTIDNIYINGPTYPSMQYVASVATHNGAAVADTPYYVSGIKAINNAKINNSYVSGFRQPVEASGTADTAVSLDNTVLEGGNYANLDWKSGDLNFHNVTTVQNSAGTEETINNTKAKVIGLGVSIGPDALSGKITISGYLNQFNWVPKNTEGITLPTIDGVNVNEMFGYVFNGILGRRMGSVTPFIHLDGKDESKSNQYINAAIVFVAAGSREQIAAYPDKDMINIQNMIDESARVEYRDDVYGYVAERTFQKLELAKLSNIGLDAVGLTGEKFTGKDVKFVALSYCDGRKWVVKADETDVEVSSDTNWDNVVTLGTDGYSINYTGYYTNYGVSAQ